MKDENLCHSFVEVFDASLLHQYGAKVDKEGQTIN